MENIKFSILMSVYYKEKPNFLKQALDSVFNQTLLPSEVVLIEDGKLTEELDMIIEEFEKKYATLKVIKYEENRGLGHALNDGLNICDNNYIFRMDTDDICRKDRFEKQIDYMVKHPEVDVLGSNILEFKDSLDETMRLKKMPQGKEIDSYILKRNPLNHMTVCFKKDSVLAVGGYQHMPLLEDYYLWVRMYVNNKKIENLNEELVYARIGNGFEKRRGNKNKLLSWRKVERYMLDNGLLSKGMYYMNLCRVYLMVYSPIFVRKLAYKYILRNK